MKKLLLLLLITASELLAQDLRVIKTVVRGKEEVYIVNLSRILHISPVIPDSYVYWDVTLQNFEPYFMEDSINTRLRTGLIRKTTGTRIVYSTNGTEVAVGGAGMLSGGNANTGGQLTQIIPIPIKDVIVQLDLEK